MTQYAIVAVNTAVNQTYHYHIPPEFADVVKIGAMVKVGFGTAEQPGIVVGLSTTSPVEQTKPILELYFDHPVLTEMQIALGYWLSETTLCAIGEALWVFIPPGIAGRRDLRVHLLDDEAHSDDHAEQKLLDLLQKRSPLTGEQLTRLLKSAAWRKPFEALRKKKVVRAESILHAPRTKPKKVQVAALSIPPEHLPYVRGRLGKRTRLSDALTEIIDRYMEDDLLLTTTDLLYIPSVGKTTLNQLIERGALVEEEDGFRPAEDSDDHLFDLKQGEHDAAILRVLARETGAVDVSWVYAQADATAADLKRLEAAGLVELGEKEVLRNSLDGMGFVPVSAPRLTAGQAALWKTVREAIDDRANTTPTTRGKKPPVDLRASQTPNATPSDALRASSPPMTGGEKPPARHAINADETPPPSPRSWGERGQGDEGLSFVKWRPTPELWTKLKPIADRMRLDPAPAEKKLWKALQKHQRGVRFRRQQVLLHYIVDFFCLEARLVIEVDGGIHDLQVEDDTVRQEALENLGLRVLRFQNEEVLNQLDQVLSKIDAVLVEQERYGSVDDATPSDALRASSPPITGGEKPLADYTTNLGEATPPSPRSWGGRGQGDEGLPPLFLLHGVTGSGKTEIYLRAIERTLMHGRQAIFLVPEIALTPQTIRRVLARFPQGVAIVHSRLSDGERFDTWRRAQEGEIQVVVGTRSALFTPLPDIGLIILDEEHDASYKQDPPTTPPYYHARDVAEQLCALHGGVLILGSATPDIETFYRAEQGDITRLSLPERIMGHRVRLMEQAAHLKPRYIVEPTSHDAMSIDLPPVQVVDMRDELKAGNTSMFSHALNTALSEVLKQGQQAILFLNRRGMSTYVFCRDCGTVVTCPRCETPMTHHEHDDSLLCHHCNTRIPASEQCANCGSRRVKFFGAGTEQVETAFKDAFPDATALRWDSDAARQPGAHDLILSRFLHHEADVLIGTQMIAKGLDLPLVTLVGVVSADVGLNLPDFRAGERVFQTLAQVAGRAGRGMLGGRVILQTYQPTHPVIVAASQHDYLGFYAAEIARRREIAYPPFRRLVRILFRDVNEAHARDAAFNAFERLSHELDEWEMTGTEIIGPVPCFYRRLNRIFRWQLILRGPDPTVLFEDFSPPRDWMIDVDPVDLL